jgi:hypothetical protein
MTLLVSAFAKRNDDVVVMKNGDRMTGEIKKLVQGRLHFKADYMAGTVELDWADVVRLESKDQFNVSLTTGKIYTGHIEKKESTKEGTADFLVSQGGSLTQATREEVFVITPVEDTMWKQFTGSIDYGFSFTGGENVTQSSLSAELNYRAEKWFFQSIGSSVFNAQSGSTTSGRNTLNILYARYLTPKWFAAAVGDLLNSQQQDLTLRTAVGGGLGRVLVRTERTWLGVLTGLNASNERYDPESGNAPQVNNAEALFQVKYTMARFSNTQVSVDLYAYPNITTPGRVRTGLQSSLKLELFRNLFWKFSVYENFDNLPPVRAPRNDFGTSTSLGWKF